MRINDEADLEIITPVPYPGKEGFYYFPQDDRIACSRDGLFLNIKTNKILNDTRRVSDGRYHVLITSPSIPHKAYSSHRILAMTFIGRPSRHLDKDYSELQVNHIDGVSTNNELANLEWCIGIENMQHAHLNGLHPKDKPVLAMNLLTKKVISFNSSKACANRFNIHRATFWKHLESGNSGNASKDNHIFKYDDDTSWNILDKSKIGTLGNNRVRRILIHDRTCNKKIVMGTTEEACKYVNMPRTTFFRKLNKEPILTIGNIDFSYL